MADETRVPTSTPKEKKVFFSWTDEETALLLKVVQDYKVASLNAGDDWETVRSKYEDIQKKFIDGYPTNKSEEFPRSGSRETFTKDKIKAKINKVKTSFRKAIDSGRRSGGGRVVCSLYDECYDIWAGSPAVESIDNGIETIDTEDVNASRGSGINSTDSPESVDVAEVQEREGEEDEIIEPLRKKMRERRDAMTASLAERRNAKCSKKVNYQDQLLQMAKDDLKLKREDMEIRKKLVDKIESSEREFQQTMQSFSESISKTMAAGFDMMKSVLQGGIQSQQQSNVYSHQWHQPYSFPPSNLEHASFTDFLNNNN